jgi:hypothetical protein
VVRVFIEFSYSKNSTTTPRCIRVSRTASEVQIYNHNEQTVRDNADVIDLAPKVIENYGNEHRIKHESAEARRNEKGVYLSYAFIAIIKEQLSVQNIIQNVVGRRNFDNDGV